MRRIHLAALAAVVLLPLGLVACGDDDNDDVAEAVDTAEDAADAARAVLGDECGDAYAAFIGIATSVSTALSGGAQDLDDAGRAMREFADDAPDEIADEVDLLVRAYGEFLEALDQADYDPASGQPPSQSQMATLAAAAESFQDEDVNAAGEKVAAYFEEHCKGAGTDDN